ncbi:MAG: hypothetical protein ABEH38_03800 [Flavobacteriales bacterium]
MARFFNFSNTEEFVLELQPVDLLSPEERALASVISQKRRYSPEGSSRQEAEKKNELRVVGRFQRFAGRDRKIFLN